MQLQQIAPHTLVTDGPADTARSAHPAPGGEAFGSVFSKEAAGQRPGPTADAPGGAGTGPGYAGQDSRTTTDAENASPAQGQMARKGSAPDGAAAADTPGAPSRATAGATSAEPGGRAAQPGRGTAGLPAPGSAAFCADLMATDLVAVPADPDKPTQAPGAGAESNTDRDPKQLEANPDATDTATANTGRPEDLSIAGAQMPAPTPAAAGSQGADPSGTGFLGAALRAAAPGSSHSGSGGSLKSVPKGGEAEGAQAAADQVAGDRLPGNAPAGTSPRGDSPERGVNAPAAVAHQGANAPGQSVAAATGADAAAATGGSVRGVPPGPTGQALGDGNQAPGSAGIQGGEAQAVQARPGMQGPTPSETQTAAGAAGSDAATAPGRTDGAAPRPVDPLTAGALQPQSGAGAATRDAPPPRVEGRAAEMAHAAAQATARPTTGPQATPAGQGTVGASASVLDRGPVAPVSDDGLFGADPLATDFGPGEIRGAGRSPAAEPAVLPASVQTPRQVTLQIAEMVRTSGERAVELRLHPEELGRVQMTLSQDATGTLTVALNVERPETLDLLRRNIDLLGADLRALGYESVDFSFQGGGSGGGAGADPDGGAAHGAAVAPAARETDMAAARAAGPQPIGRGAGAPGDGIDIRI